MTYRRCGRSGLLLPMVSLGLWHNFGDDKPLEVQQAILRRAFDLGVTHFDLANNYGPPYGAAERNFGGHHGPRLPALPRRARHLDQGRLRHVAGAVRRPRVAQVPAGLAWTSRWPGWGWTTSTSSTATASTRTRRWRRPSVRWSRRWSPAGRSTPGSRPTRRERTQQAATLLRGAGVPLLIHQPSYSMLNRWVEESLLDTLDDLGVGCIAFSPLAQGMLTDRYLKGIPAGSRAASDKSLSAGPDDGRSHAAHPGAQPDGRRAAVRRSPSWRCPGCCATSGLPASSSARRRSSSSRQNLAAASRAAVHRRGAAFDRPARGRGGHRPLEAVAGLVSR